MRTRREMRDNTRALLTILTQKAKSQEPRHMTQELAVRVLAATQAHGTAARVLNILANTADEHNLVSGISLQAIAELVDVTLRRMMAIMAQLRASGEVELVKRGGGRRTNTYRIHVRPNDAV